MSRAIAAATPSTGPLKDLGHVALFECLLTTRHCLALSHSFSGSYSRQLSAWVLRILQQPGLGFFAFAIETLLHAKAHGEGCPCDAF